MVRTTNRQENRHEAEQCRSVLGASLLLVSGCLLAAGCGGQQSLPTEVIHGTVTVGDQTPETGHVRFVPIEGTPGPASTAAIVDGQYRIEARGGVPVGRHRVEVTAVKKTGRKVTRPAGPAGQPMEVDETVPLAAPEYAGPASPLTKEVVAGTDGRIDIEIPSPSGGRR